MTHTLKRDLDALASTTFDLCVIGGGITGLCVAHDASSRGLSVALLERGDFAQGTSSASTKLIHGGTRYLEHYEFALVREALRERRILLRLAPHATNPVPFMIPIYKGGPVSAPLIRAGMLLYDALSYDKNWETFPDKRMPRHRYVSAREALRLEPELKEEGLAGASLYCDGQVPNPMRLCIEIAKTAAGNGARLANYAPVVGFRRESGRIQGVEARDLLGGRDFSVKASATVNCTGIWAEEVMKLLGRPPPVRLKPSKGIHLITRRLSRTHAVVSVSPTGRRVMLIPWRGRTLVGTTDDFYSGDLDRIRTTAEEAQVLMDEINAFMPSAKLGLSDVEACFAGARPLIEEDGKKASDLSRSYRIVDHERTSGLAGVLSAVGGKLTTSRAMAEAITDRVLHKLGRSAPCPTESLPLGGGDLGVIEEYVARQKDAVAGLVDDEVLRELVCSYGTAYVDVLEYARKEPRLAARIAPDRPFILAEVRHALDHEMAITVADVALRRTDAGNLGDKDLAVGRAIADEMASALGLAEAERERQLAEYRDLIAMDGLGADEAAGTAARSS
jgi:glycerol-3-phosphate dehydrogenase